MKIPVEIKPAVWGAIGGAIALAIVGFNWGGWVTGGKAEADATERAHGAVVSALAPVCVEKFQHQADAAEKLVEFTKVSSSWGRRAIIEKGGWAATAGSDAPNSAVVTACAEQLGGRL